MTAALVECPLCGRRHRVPEEKVSIVCSRMGRALIVTVNLDGSPALRAVYRWGEDRGAVLRLRRQLEGVRVDG